MKTTFKKTISVLLSLIMAFSVFNGYTMGNLLWSCSYERDRYPPLYRN